MNKERIVTILITTGLFGGLIGGPIASLVDYHASAQKRLWLFIVPEFIGFACAGLMVYYDDQEKSNQLIGDHLRLKRALSSFLGPWA